MQDLELTFELEEEELGHVVKVIFFLLCSRRGGRARACRQGDVFCYFVVLEEGRKISGMSSR